MRRSRFLLAFLLFLLCFLSACSRANVGAKTAAPTELSFLSHGDTLAATLLLPKGNGPFPGAIIVHGSGSSDRRNPWTQAYVQALVQRGVAVLYPDKRGSGKSQGDWSTAPFELLADDALAAFEQLLRVPHVDPERAGLIGFSQGGDIVPLAATRSPKVRFVIDVSGSVVPLLEQIGDEIRQAGIEEGVSSDELETLQAIHTLGATYALSGDGWPDYHEALQAAQSGALKDGAVLGEFPKTPDSPAWGFLRVVGDFDPLPYWKRLEVPALFLYGGKDRNVDVPKSVEIIERSFSTSRSSHSVLLFGNNGHALFRDDALDFIVRWIRDRGMD